MKKVSLMIAIIIIGICTWITLTDRWIAPAVNRWQSGLTSDGSYFPKLTILILAVPPLAVLAVIRRAIEHKRKP